MEPSHSTRDDCVPLRTRTPAGGRHIGAVALTVVVGLLVTPSAVSAAPAAGTSASTSAGAPAGSLPAEPVTELDKLEARAAKLSKKYRGRLVRLDEVKSAAKQATKRVEAVDRRLEKARSQVARLAASQYMSGGLDPALTPLLDENPDAVLNKAVTTEHLARGVQERVMELHRLRQQRETAQELAKKQVGEVREEIQTLEKRQGEVDKLLAKFSPESPVMGDSVTPRMLEVRDAVDRRFGPFSIIGCWRAGSYGEHPQGRACDFMLSTGGAMPSADEVQLGWDISNWARANASELGIMYIIYRQQIWDIRSGGGWAPMEDRGSITANHYDHVHISVL